MEMLVESPKVNKNNLERLSFVGYKNNSPVLQVRCNICGNIFETWASQFYGNRNPCKCLKHNWKKERLYGIWTNMKTRCHNKISNRYTYYKNKGIEVCEEWKTNYVNFRTWAIENGYSEELSIDRIDGDKGYFPDNCRWATSTTQNKNRSCNINITLGEETKCLKDWCQTLGINYKTEHTYLSRHGIDNMIIRLQKKAKFYIEYKIKMLEDGQASK